jgi:protein SCO1/2
MANRSMHRSLGIVFLVLLVLSACSMFKPAFKADVIDPATAAPQISMSDQNGNPFQMSAMQGKVVLLFFGFTNCVDECPLTMAHIKTALGMLGEKAQDVRVVLVSTDPARDTPMALQDFLGKFDPSYIGIPGTVDELKKVWDAYGIVVLNGGETHSSFTYVIDRGNKLRLRIEAEADPKDMASDIERLLAE